MRDFLSGLFVTRLGHSRQEGYVAAWKAIGIMVRAESTRAPKAVPAPARVLRPAFAEPAQFKKWA